MSRNNTTTPVGWVRKPLSELARYYNGLAFKPSDWSEEGTRIIRIEQLNNPTGQYDCYQGQFPDSSRIDNGDLVFSWSATLKAIIWKHGTCVLNQHLFKVVPSSDVSKEYLLYILEYNMDSLGGGSQGSTMRHIKRSELNKYKVDIPLSIHEQREIARILTAVDNQIEQTEALIAKYQSVKQGMMHDLFTRGVDQHGHLRPPQPQAPHLYKQSPLGWIPKEWEVNALGYYIAYISYGFTNPMPSTHEGPYMVTAANIFDGKIQYSTARHTSKEAFNNLLTNKSRPIKNDILLTKDGTLGRLAIVDIEGLCINQSVSIIRTNDLMTPQFMQILLESKRYQEMMLGDAGGSTIKHIYITVVDKMPIAAPSMKNEQNMILGIVKTITKSIELEKVYLENLRQTKQGLMQDLLTGKVRVSGEE